MVGYTPGEKNAGDTLVRVSRCGWEIKTRGGIFKLHAYLLLARTLASMLPLRRSTMKFAKPSRRRQPKQFHQYTAKYTPTDTGFVGQIIDWPEVISEGRSLKECQESVRDALHQMILAYRELGREVPSAGSLTEQIAVEI
jgi:predicted RNase H-like HicB family nuclease